MGKRKPTGEKRPWPRDALAFIAIHFEDIISAMTHQKCDYLDIQKEKARTSRRVFFRATMRPVDFSRALYTFP